MHIKRILLISAILPALVGNFQLPARAGGDDPHYAGVEFYGSSQMTRLELQKMLGIRPGASAGATESAKKRVEKQLDSRHLDAHVEIVKEADNQLYVVVDISDSTEEAPVRKLNSPHHVDVRTEKPFLLLADLKARIDEVEGQGRSVTETMTDGFKSYSDEPCNQIVKEIRNYAGVMRLELIAVVDADPNPERRIQAVELLGWAGDFQDSIARLIPAIDDIDPYVRASVDRFFFPRLDLLTPGFPLPQLTAAWSRQITRHSHEDRAKGLYCLLAICTMHPKLVHRVRLASGKRIRELSDTTILPTVKTPADKLLALFAQDARPKAPAPTGLPFLHPQDATTQ